MREVEVLACYGEWPVRQGFAAVGADVAWPVELEPAVAFGLVVCAVAAGGGGAAPSDASCHEIPLGNVPSDLPHTACVRYIGGMEKNEITSRDRIQTIYPELDFRAVNGLEYENRNAGSALYSIELKVEQAEWAAQS
jgi:hypothetical protein